MALKLTEVDVRRGLAYWDSKPGLERSLCADWLEMRAELGALRKVEEEARELYYHAGSCISWMDSAFMAALAELDTVRGKL